MGKAELSVNEVLPPPRAMAVEAEQRGDWPAAARHWQGAHQAARDDRAIALSMIRAMRLAGSCGAASPHLADLLAQNAKDNEALLEMAKCHLVSGRPEAAEITLAALLEARPDWWEPHTTLAVVLDRAGRHAEALPHHDQAIALATGKPIVLANKGLSLALAGRLPEALAVTRQAAALPGAPARVRVNLAVLEALAGDGDRAATILSQENMEDKADGMAQLKRMARTANKLEVTR